MRTYFVEVIETLSKKVEVEANDTSEAIEKAKDMYHNEEIILDNEDYLDTEFEIAD